MGIFIIHWVLCFNFELGDPDSKNFRDSKTSYAYWCQLAFSNSAETATIMEDCSK